VDGLSWGCETGSCEQGGHRCQGKNHLRILMSSQFPVSLREDWLSVFSLITKNWHSVWWVGGLSCYWEPKKRSRMPEAWIDWAFLWSPHPYVWSSWHNIM
jgi:hypothetical protein